eukprot:scaffold247008_cov19-Tisochrysis_lutea.AAC.4
MLLLVPSIRSCKQTPPKQRIATATRNKIIQQSVTQKRIHTHRIQQSVALSPMFLHQNPAISDPKLRPCSQDKPLTMSDWSPKRAGRPLTLSGWQVHATREIIVRWEVTHHGKAGNAQHLAHSKLVLLTRAQVCTHKAGQLAGAVREQSLQQLHTSTWSRSSHK